MTIKALVIRGKASPGLASEVLDGFLRGAKLGMVILVLQRGFTLWSMRVIPAVRLISYWAGIAPNSWAQASSGTVQQP